MGQLIDLAAERARRHPLAAAMERLDAAVTRLDPLVGGREDRLGPAVRTELVAIAEAVRRSRPDEAARRAERLADRLEHPAALGS
jgi:hypothetical protein